MAGRRDLTFSRLDEVMPEVERLLTGHETIGQWSLGQICHHLGRAFRGSVDGIPFRAPWLLRMTIAPLAFRHVMKTGRMREGIKLPEAAVPRPGLDARAEADGLRAALAYFTAAAGPPAVHPFFGRISRADWERLHLIHCAHHLSFALPTAGASAKTSAA